MPGCTYSLHLPPPCACSGQEDGTRRNITRKQICKRSPQRSPPTHAGLTYVSAAGKATPECEQWRKGVLLPTCFNRLLTRSTTPCGCCRQGAGLVRRGAQSHAPNPLHPLFPAAGKTQHECLGGSSHAPQTSHPLSPAAGKVRPECVEGLKCVLGLRRVAWARQVDSMRLMPTSAQMGLIEKRFGGALS